MIPQNSVNWDTIPPEYKWVAMDQNKSLNAFCNKPEHFKTGWIEFDRHDNPNYDFLSLQKLTGVENSNWKECILQRPSMELNAFDVKWSDLPSDFNWVAVDKFGSTHAFKTKPALCATGWYETTANPDVEHSRYGIIRLPNRKSNAWEYSLMQRPSVTPLQRAQDIKDQDSLKLIADLKKQLESIRNDTLEEAALVCESRKIHNNVFCAVHIRALKE